MTEQLVGQTLAGKYRIEELLREDAFGKTFRATHVLMEKPVAVKVLNPELATNAPVVADFQQEAKLLSRLSHPHVLSVTDYGVDEQIGVPFLVMENFEGRTLKDLIREEGALPLNRAVQILTQTADAVGVAHENGLVHGALRSDSILLTGARDFVKVVDFDAANKTSNIDLFDRATPNTSAETVAYLAPEQCNDSSATDQRSDVYSLGIILYEALTGRLPFVGSSTTEVMMKHAQEIPPSLLAVRHDLPPTFEQIVQRALAKNPNQRFQTAAEFSAALAGAVEGAPLAPLREVETIVRPRGEVAAAATEIASDSRWRTAFIVLAGISLLSVGLFYFTQNRRTTPPTDPNSSPVQPINPATGVPEQNLSTDFSNLQFNSNLDANLSTIPPGGAVAPDVPYGGRIPPGIYQNYPPGYVDPNSNSPFMPDLNNQTQQPSPKPSATPKQSVSPTPTGSPAANASPTPQTSPKPSAQPTPAAPTPNPANSPKPAATPKPSQPPARSTPIPKPTQPVTEKSAQNLPDRISER